MALDSDLLAHQLNESIKEICSIMGASGRFRVILDRKRWSV
jgi:hypothetical protein